MGSAASKICRFPTTTTPTDTKGANSVSPRIPSAPEHHHQSINGANSNSASARTLTPGSYNSIYCPPPPDSSFKEPLGAKGGSISSSKLAIDRSRSSNGGQEEERSRKVEATDPNPDDQGATDRKTEPSHRESSRHIDHPSKSIIDQLSKSALIDPISLPPIDHWTTNDVDQWLIANGLEQFRAKFENIDGRKLATLYEMYVKAPNAYFKEIKRFLDKPGLDVVLQFTSALQALKKEGVA